MTIKVDLHNHGIIGFQPSWGDLQGYDCTNLADKLSDVAIKKGIDIVAVTSEDFEITPRSYADRFSQLRDEARSLCKRNKDVRLSDIDENLFKITKPVGYFDKPPIKSVYFVNGQTVIVIENGKRYDHLVVGSNQVPNSRTFDDTINYCADNGLLNFLEHPPLEAHFGAGISRSRELVEKYGKKITGVEGHNAHMIWPSKLSKVPFIGAFNQGVNVGAIDFAKETGMPYIGTSDAHSPNQTGAGNIEFLGEKMPGDDNDKNFRLWMRRNIEDGNYVVNDGYVGAPSWIWNAGLFACGKKLL